jgi:hypothetical protein
MEQLSLDRISGLQQPKLKRLTVRKPIPFKGIGFLTIIQKTLIVIFVEKIECMGPLSS